MKLSFEWLGEYVDVAGLTAEDVAEKLTMGAFEVEEITYFGPDIVGPVIVGEILEINPHPNADKIRVTKVRLAEGAEPKEIVCGAWNIEVGHRITVALPGARVLNRLDGSALLIKESKIRGVTSNGMLCSAPELGITGDGEGIHLLDPSVPLGADALEVLQIKRIPVLHVEPRSNRGDALCVAGLAREVAALCGRPLKKPAWQEEFASMAQHAEKNRLEVKLENAGDCPFFSIRVLTGAAVGPAPAWMIRRLESIGLRSVNNIVDITNYVLYELGQPLHAYDLKQIKGAQLAVRRAKAGEQLLTLDDRQRQLDADVLVIADSDTVLGVAGVMGGKSSEVTDHTTEIALEAAAFGSGRVRRSSRVLGLSSDSSLRFERGVDSASVHHASDRAAYLLVKHAGANLAQFSCAGDDAVAEQIVPVRLSALKRLADIELSAEQAAALLLPLGFHCSGQGEQLQVSVPSFRQKDVQREIDVIEELVRLWGYDRIEPVMPEKTMAPAPPPAFGKRLRQLMSALGFSEAWTSSLVARDDLTFKGLLDEPSASAISVLNPLSVEHQMMRQSLLPGLLKAAAYNQDHGQDVVWLFELGRIYQKDVSCAQSNGRSTGTKEKLVLAGLMTGDPQQSHWCAPSATEGEQSSGAYFTIKGVLEELFGQLKSRVAGFAICPAESAPPVWHPFRAATLSLTPKTAKKMQAEVVGWLGELHPQLLDKNHYGLKGRVAAFEIEVERLADCLPVVAFAEPANTPLVVRDLTVDVPADITNAAVEKLVGKAAGNLLQEIALVSVYELSEEMRSLSYRLSFQESKKTLTSEAVDLLLQNIRQRLKTDLNAQFRDVVQV